VKAVDFDYLRATSLDAACRALAGAGGEAKIIAGGQTLVPLLAMRLARPALLVDITAIAELDDIAEADGRITVRAVTRQSAALGNALLCRRVPLLAKALGFVGHVQTRNRGTIGGSIANADPAAEIALVAQTLGATMTARSLAGERDIAAADFFLGAMTTALAPEECLTAVSFPVWPEERIGTGFREVSVRRSDFALAAAAAELAFDARGRCRRAAVGIGGGAPLPLRCDGAAARLVGTAAGAADIAAAVEAALVDIEFLSDLHASARYRRRIAAAMLERALAEARDEALAGGA
jgi:CO/xanthine dehydrogenase FAD-binding subunit